VVLSAGADDELPKTVARDGVLGWVLGHEPLVVVGVPI